MKDILNALSAIDRIEKEQLTESTVAEVSNFDSKKVSTGTVYSRKYDPETGETTGTQRTDNDAKRGRGRPKANAGNDGEVMKPDWSAFGVKPVKLSKDPNARKIKGRDTIDTVDESAVMKRALEVIEGAVMLEKEMTDAQMAKREEIVKGMKKNMAGFKKRYGNRAEAVMYATATKQAMAEGADSYMPSGEDIMGKRPEDETMGDKVKKFAKKLANKIAPDDETLLRDLEKKTIGEDKVELTDADNKVLAMIKKEIREMEQALATAPSEDSRYYKDRLNDLHGMVRMIHGKEPYGLDTDVMDEVSDMYRSIGAVFYESGSLVKEGSVKSSMMKDAETMSKADFIKKHGKENADTWENMNESVVKKLAEGKDDDKKDDKEPPFEGGKKSPDEHKDEFGNVIKDKNIAKHLAKKGMKEFMEAVDLAECGEPMMPTGGDVTISGTPDALAAMLKMAGMQAPAMTPMEEGKQDRIQKARDLIDRACGLDACSPEELGDHRIDMIAQATGLKRGHVRSIANHMDDEANEFEDKQEVDEWANSPEGVEGDEEYQGIDAAIPSGDDLHREKGAYPATAGGDNPMAIDEEMWAAYQALKSELQ